MQRHSRFSLLPLLGTALALALAAAAAAQPGYFRYTQIDPPFYPMLLGNDGSLVTETYGGDFNIATAVYHNGSQDTFAVPGAFETFPADINAAGTVVGTAADENYDAAVGFIHTRSGQFTTYSYPGAVWTSLSGINDAGTIVGVWYSDTDAGFFLLDASGNATPLKVPGYEGVFWKDLNNAGTVLGEDGTNAYLLSGSQVTQFPVTQNGYGYVLNINNRGQVLYVDVEPVQVPGFGTYFVPSSFVRDASGVLHPVDYQDPLPASLSFTWYDGSPVTLALVQRLGTFALGMNDRGQVLGGVQALYSTTYRGQRVSQVSTTLFLATPGGSPQ